MPNGVNALVHECEVQGPATHALVVGVGSYPYLLGGDHEAGLNVHEGMGQLSSPPVSARAVADWIISAYRYPDAPLGTVSLLLSEEAPAPYVNPQTTVAFRVPRATADNVCAAVRDWKACGDSSGADRLLFYFSGHGISQGADMALLLEDFGADSDNALNGALDFRKLHGGLTRAAARRQCFFIDACRASADTLIEGTEGYAGRVPLAPRREPGGGPKRQGPVFYATLGGEEAYARPGKISIFADALLLSLNGAGADDSEGDWRVTTTKLQSALDFLMKQAHDRGFPQVQTPQSAEHSTFFLHHLEDAPLALARVFCDPNTAFERARLACYADGKLVAERDAALPDQIPEWEVALKAGEYGFVAEFADGSFQRDEKSRFISPTYKRVKLQVGP